jgi:polysaccharide export outer membrane protein
MLVIKNNAIKNITIPLLIIFLLNMGSCVSNKKYIYLQDKGGLKTDSAGANVFNTQKFSYKLQEGDILYISLTSEDDRLNRIFVPGGGNGQMVQQGQGVSGTAMYYLGFTIDTKGEVEFPFLGKIFVKGLNIEEAKFQIEKQLKIYFKEFFLQVKLAEFKFSILGYVNRPGQYFFQQNKVTLLEAISQAGDLTNLANRYEVHLYRQYDNGVQLHKIDLTDRNLITSPFWYIQPNDIVYVVPLKTRTLGDLSSVQSTLGVVAPILSSLLLVINTYILVKNLN